LERNHVRNLSFASSGVVNSRLNPDFVSSEGCRVRPGDAERNAPVLSDCVRSDLRFGLFQSGGAAVGSIPKLREQLELHGSIFVASRPGVAMSITTSSCSVFDGWAFHYVLGGQTSGELEGAIGILFLMGTRCRNVIGVVSV